jgi:uncharacterized membrane protein YbhN (UPF0104 family)
VARQKVKLWVKLAVTLGVLVLVFRVVPWRERWHDLQNLDPLVWLACFAGFIAGHALGVFKWRLNVNLGRANLGVLDATQCYSAGMFANLFLPSIVGGDALKAILAGKITGRFEAAVFGGLTERLLDTIALLVLILVGGLVSRSAIGGWGGNAVFLGSLLGVIGVALFAPLLLRMKLERWPRKLRRPLGRAMVAMRRMGRQPGLALFVFAMSLAIQSWFVLLNAWLGAGVGVELPLSVWFLAVPLAKAISLAPISIGGFGVREGSMASLLVMTGVDKARATLAALMWPTILVPAALLGGALWFVLGFRASAKTGAGHDSLLTAGQTSRG